MSASNTAAAAALAALTANRYHYHSQHIQSSSDLWFNAATSNNQQNSSINSSPSNISTSSSQGSHSSINFQPQFSTATSTPYDQAAYYPGHSNAHPSNPGYGGYDFNSHLNLIGYHGFANGFLASGGAVGGAHGAGQGGYQTGGMLLVGGESGSGLTGETGAESLGQRGNTASPGEDHRSSSISTLRLKAREHSIALGTS